MGTRIEDDVVAAVEEVSAVGCTLHFFLHRSELDKGFTRVLRLPLGLLSYVQLGDSALQLLLSKLLLHLLLHLLLGKGDLLGHIVVRLSLELGNDFLAQLVSFLLLQQLCLVLRLGQYELLLQALLSGELLLDAVLRGQDLLLHLVAF